MTDRERAILERAALLSIAKGLDILQRGIIRYVSFIEKTYGLGSEKHDVTLQPGDTVAGVVGHESL